MRKYIINLLICLIMLTLISCVQKRKQIVYPPKAVKKPKTFTIMDTKFVDNYAWMKDKKNPEVKKYLDAENKYTDYMMQPTQDLQKKLYDEFISRIKEDEVSLPVKMGKYLYYSKSEKNKPYDIHFRRLNKSNSVEEVLLDENLLAEGSKYFDMGVYEISPKQNILAFSVDSDGSEKYTLYFKDLKAGNLLKDKIKNVDNVEWAANDEYVFYTTINDEYRADKIYLHKLGTKQSTDKLILAENDASYNLDVSKSKSKKYIFLTSANKITSECYYLEAVKPSAKPILIQPRINGMEYYPEHKGNKFYIMTNYKAKNYRIVTTPITKPDFKHWKTYVKAKRNTTISDFDLFKDYLVVYEKVKGSKQIMYKNFATKKTKYISFPETDYNIMDGLNYELNTDILQFEYESMTTPLTVYDYNLKDQTRKVVKEYLPLNPYNHEDYQTEYKWATAKDGEKIPISVVYKKGIKLDKNTPLLLYAYGSYGLSEDVYFSSTRLSLLDRGFVYAVAHIRGGSEMGIKWHEQGKLLKKKNTFNDFIACAEYLIKENYTSPERLVIQGGSAGGMLMGAVLNERPELFKAALAEVPFVDVLNTMLDPTLPSTVPEYDEWGNPQQKKFFEYILSYSPYNNIKKQKYPAILVVSGYNDSRVSYWEPAKWVAKLRANKTDKNPLLLRMYMNEGHSGSSDRYSSLRELAFEYAFMFQQLNIVN